VILGGFAVDSEAYKNEPEQVTNDSLPEIADKEIVTICATDFRLPEVHRHAKAGRIVYVMPAQQPPSAA
jgi:hypothetical protein